MGFLDKAKAAANELAAKADTALGNAGLGGAVPSSGGEADRYFRDLGVLAYLEAGGRAGDPSERGRLLTALHELEARGSLGDMALKTGASSATSSSPPPPPPPPSWLTSGGGT